MAVEGQNALNDSCKLITAATFKLAGCKSQNRLFVFTYTDIRKSKEHFYYLLSSPEVKSDNEMRI